MKTITFKAPEDDHSRWKTAAAEARVSFSEFVRRALNTVVGSGEVAPPAEQSEVEPTTAPPAKKVAAPSKGKCDCRLPSGSFCKRHGKTKA